MSKCPKCGDKTECLQYHICSIPDPPAPEKRGSMIAVNCDRCGTKFWTSGERVTCTPCLVRSGEAVTLHPEAFNPPAPDDLTLTGKDAKRTGEECRAALSEDRAVREAVNAAWTEIKRDEKGYYPFNEVVRVAASHAYRARQPEIDGLRALLREARNWLSTISRWNTAEAVRVELQGLLSRLDAALGQHGKEE